MAASCWSGPALSPRFMDFGCIALPCERCSGFPRRGFVTDNRMHSEAWFVRKRRIDNMNNVYMRKPCSCG